MMYAELQQGVSDFLNRDDLTATIPTFVALAEARLQRDVRHWRGEKRTTISATGQFTALPADYLEATRLTINGWPIDLVTQDWIAGQPDGPGRPVAYAITGGEVELWPIPIEPVDVVVAYYATLPRLSDAETVNWLLETAPDAYLYGSLLHTAPYLQEDARLTVWASLYESAVNALNIESTKARMPGKLVMRNSGGRNG